MSEIRKLYIEAELSLLKLKDAIDQDYLRLDEAIAETDGEDSEIWDARDIREYELQQLSMMIDELQELNIDDE